MSRFPRACPVPGYGAGFPMLRARRPESSQTKRGFAGDPPPLKNNPGCAPLPAPSIGSHLGLWPRWALPQSCPRRQVRSLLLARLGREDRGGTCCSPAPAGYGFNKNSRKAQRGGGAAGGGRAATVRAVCVTGAVTPWVKRKLLRKVRAPPPPHCD